MICVSRVCDLGLEAVHVLLDGGRLLANASPLSLGVTQAGLILRERLGDLIRGQWRITDGADALLLVQRPDAFLPLPDLKVKPGVLLAQRLECVAGLRQSQPGLLYGPARASAAAIRGAMVSWSRFRSG